ncbi:nucleotidyltransferase AbiEii toxin of type IV toxin-antitoxin system [Lacibacter cauensis]|uniref:Nucleotidyltransferase AbiEii toxin of type IV toxin-antitoxin system n=1 Tax=Lacibacter cauensis TaxID=510947 RepID=A0A562SDJ6_9BACT|nr:nucleotidyl transferase AbiEii/AbiGii toxin family protein [Lacibacter cauensis]TWI79034.1 nucleotidyltransferase AbiEii toxin of type IV toxin-antitoxin system [Lacibacter cauensis]
MTGWLLLTEEQRKTTISEAQIRSGVIESVKAIEKDWWVTLVLKALFQSAYAEHLVFKGGTSLSKGFKLINRFSEDIDLALGCEAFGMQYEENPTPSYISRLRRKGFDFATTKLLDELRNQLTVLGVPDSMVILDFEPSPPNQTPADPVTIYVKYKSLYDTNKYIADQVKIELSVRSRSIPFTTRPVLSLLTEFFFNDAYEETAFDVTIVEPRKTFLEKVFLLHEEFSKKEKAQIRTERMSRHLYDLATMMQTNVLNDALADHALYDSLIDHRRKYIAVSWADYDTLHHSTISFIPPAEVVNAYEFDYAIMLSEMIYGDSLDFKAIIEQLKVLQEKIRQKLDVK